MYLSNFCGIISQLLEFKGNKWGILCVWLETCNRNTAKCTSKLLLIDVILLIGNVLRNHY